MAKGNDKATPKRKLWKPAFLHMLAQMPVVRAAIQHAGIEPSTAYRARDKSPEFARQWDEALQQGVQAGELEAWRRARGLNLGEGERPSDVLLIFMLKAHGGEHYRDTVRQEVTGRNGGAIQIQAVDYRTTISPLAPIEDGSMADRLTSG